MKRAFLLLLVLALALPLAASAENNNLTPWGLDKSETYLIPVYTHDLDANKYYERFSETEVGKVILDKFNIDFEYILYTESEVEKANLLLVAGDYSDVIGMQGATVRASYVGADALLNLDPYLERMTNFTAYYGKQLPYWRAQPGNDGHIYYWQGNGIPAGWGGWSSNGAMVRVDALKLYAEKYGWDNPPMYTDDFVELLRLAKEAGLTDVNGDPAVGLTGCFGESWGLKGIAQSLAENSHYVGSANRLMVYDLLTDSYVPYHETDYLVDQFKFFNDCWQIGMLDEECFTMTGATLNDLEKTAGCVMAWYTSWDTWVNEFIMEAGHPDKQYITMVVLASTYDDPDYTFTYGSTPTNDFDNWAIAANARYPDRLCEYVDFICSEEGQQLFRNGIEGVHWTRDEEGDRVYVEEHFKKYTAGYPEYSEEYKALTGIGGMAFGMVSGNTFSEDGKEATISETTKHKLAYVNKEAITYEMMTNYGWVDCLTWLRENSELIDMTAPNSVEFEAGSDWIVLYETLVDTRVQHIFDIWTADSDEEFEAEWQKLLDAYAGYDLAGYAEAYNALAKEVQAAGTAGQ